ncbi:glutathione S-transferase family protein [Fulvimarina sp. 2208YS6-2-32]|nr:glutathione S-transferase family protein [Fulvimarina sp. 2208YS6-2-32]
MAITLYELVGTDDAKPFSPHCWKVRMCLRHKGLAFRTESVRFTEIPHIEGGVARTLPILRDGDHLIIDSFRIADHLETRYPDRPSLFGGENGRNYARFLEGWALRDVHLALTRIAALEILELLDLPDQEHFRRSREARFGSSLEHIGAHREELVSALRETFEPVRRVLSETPFLGGKSPLFADFVIFGALQWVRIVSEYPILLRDDPINEWFERCLDLYDGEGRSVAARSD